MRFGSPTWIIFCLELSTNTRRQKPNAELFLHHHALTCRNSFPDSSFPLIVPSCFTGIITVFIVIRQSLVNRVHRCFTLHITRARTKQQGDVPLHLKIAAGLTTGAIGISIASPTDLVKVRLQAEGKLPAGAVKKYPSAMAAYGIIVKQEGFAVRGASK